MSDAPGEFPLVLGRGQPELPRHERPLPGALEHAPWCPVLERVHRVAGRDHVFENHHGALPPTQGHRLNRPKRRQPLRDRGQVFGGSHVLFQPPGRGSGQKGAGRSEGQLES